MNSMSNAKEIFLTAQGLNDLKVELDELINVKRPAIIESLKEARAQGDLSENAEYDSARDEQAKVESKIQELEAILESAQIIKHISTGFVELGSVVKVEYIDDNEIEEYTIVGSKEADPFTHKISNESPIATAIIGKKEGAIVSVSSPNGKYDIKIVSVK